MFHHHLDNASWMMLLEIKQLLSPAISPHHQTLAISEASSAGCCACHSTPSVVSASQRCPYCRKGLAAFASIFSFLIYTVYLFVFYHVCGRVLGLCCSSRDAGSKSVMVKTQRDVSILRSWTNPVHHSVLRTGLDFVCGVTNLLMPGCCQWQHPKN